MRSWNISKVFALPCTQGEFPHLYCIIHKIFIPAVPSVAWQTFKFSTVQHARFRCRGRAFPFRQIFHYHKERSASRVLFQRDFVVPFFPDAGQQSIAEIQRYSNGQGAARDANNPLELHAKVIACEVNVHRARRGHR